MLFTEESDVEDILSAKDVDAILSKVAEVARKLRSARNAFVPISRLPPELLSAIFMSLQDTDQGTFAPASFRRWYRVTHVCQRWRDVALSCPPLWTQIDTFTHERWVEEVLNRSRKASLDMRVQLSRPSSRTLGAWRMAVAHLSRMQVLHLSLDKKTFDNLLPVSVVTEVEMQRLTSLVISNLHRFDEPLDLPEGLFNRGAPNLQRLEIQHCTISWNMPLLLTCPRVRKLAIQSAQPTPPTTSQLLHILQSMPLLEDLRLSETLPSVSTSESSMVHLQHLTKLALRGNAPQITNLLNIMHIPPRVTTSLFCHTPTHPSELATLGATLRPFFTQASSPNGFYISATEFGIRVHTGSKTIPPRRLSAWEDFADEGSSMLTISRASSQQFLPVLAHSLPLNNISALAVEDDQRFLDCDTFCSVLQVMPNVRTLQVYGEAGMHVTEVLCTETEGDGTAATRALLLPKLEHLHLQEVEMCWNVNHANLLNRLQEMQFLRSERGQAISELSMTMCCDVAEEEVRVLCHLFVDVHWDGFKARGSEADDDDDDEEGQELWDMWEGDGVGWHS
ncbi:hypothetical protein BC835DRAFT_811383 [Cytidiella melzeri]|nr:hypothetical protein BC835DRAFT_811383 [Cytidiella melzeri]